MRRFYEQTLWIPQNFPPTNPDLHHGLLDGLSLLCFGFPVANARPISTLLDGGIVNFLGCACHTCHFDPDLNATIWNRLPLAIGPQSNFVFPYKGPEQKIDPHGFSGCGVWIAGLTPGSILWSPDLALVGVVHRHVEKLSVLIATNLEAVFRVIEKAYETQ
jgi:hypothetical protein